MKGKAVKYILPFFGIILIAAAVIRFQDTRQAGSGGSPEETLQEALEGTADPGNINTEMGNIISDNPVTILHNMQVLLQEQDPDTTGENTSPDATGLFLTENILLHDLYASSGQTVKFHLYCAGASNYLWEYYDVDSRKWLPAEGNTGEEMDAYGRYVAYADFVADQPELMIRCLYDTEDATGQSEIAYLKALPQEISQLSLADDITAEAGELLESCNIAVKVTYTDGSSDTLEGLYGLYFVESEESESSEILLTDGILTEKKVLTVLSHYKQCCVVPEGESCFTMAYIPGKESPKLQLTGVITGMDGEPPEIFQVDILDREKLPDSENESLTILVTAEDNVTPYPGLQYAVIEKDMGTVADDIDIGKIAEEDWFSGPKATVTLKKSSTWFLCCRDQAGNVSIYQQGDPDPPVVPEERLEGLSGTEADTQAPVIRNIYVEADES